VQRQICNKVRHFSGVRHSPVDDVILLLLASLSDILVLTELLRVAQDPKVALILGVFKILKSYFK
jgi:hypothetical protein